MLLKCPLVKSIASATYNNLAKLRDSVPNVANTIGSMAQRMKHGNFSRESILACLLVTLMLTFGAVAQPSPLTGNPALTKFFGSNACVARCDLNVRSDSFRAAVKLQFAFRDGNLRWEMDASQMAVGMMPPEAMKQSGTDLQVIITRPDLKLDYVIYPRLKSCFVHKFGENDTKIEPTMESTELGKETLDHHSCTKTKFINTTADGHTFETIAWFAADLHRFPIKLETTEAGTISTMTFSQIQFTKTEVKQFEPPAEFKKYDEFLEMMEEAEKTFVPDKSATNNIPDPQIIALRDYTLRKGTNHPLLAATAKVLGLGEEKIPALQLIIGNKEGGPIHCFAVSMRNSNDLFVAQIDRITRKGVVWFTSPTGKIRTTLLTATNAAPEIIGDPRTAEFQQELEHLTAFITPPPWEDAVHPLNVAAKFGALSDVAGVLKHSKKALNKRDDEGQTPLADAVVQEEVDTVRYLLEQGADPNIPNKNGLTPLDHACSRGEAAMPLAKLLLDHGALVNPQRSGSFRITSLDWAISSDNTELTKLLIEHRADIKAVTDVGRTALHNAANRGDLEIAKTLIEHGADVNAKVTNGWTPLHYAASASRKDIVELLLAKGADINSTDIHGKTPLAWAQGADVKDVLRQHGAK